MNKYFIVQWVSKAVYDAELQAVKEHSELKWGLCETIYLDPKRLAIGCKDSEQEITFPFDFEGMKE